MPLQSGTTSFIFVYLLYVVFRPVLEYIMPRTPKYVVDLSADERAELQALLAASTHKTYGFSRVRDVSSTQMTARLMRRPVKPSAATLARLDGSASAIPRMASQR